MKRLDDDAYARLLALRTGLRRFERWSAEQAEAAGLTSAQHQLLLAVRGHAGPPAITIGEVADYLLLRHHSAVGLVDRAEAAGLVRRVRDDEDHRVVRVELTDDGARRLERLSALHLEELERLALDLPRAWTGLEPAPRGGARRERAPARTVAVARVYEPADPAAGELRILVDRLWPRGVARRDAPFSRWAKELAPSTELRRWYGHEPDRFAEFRDRYLAELRAPGLRGEIASIARSAEPLVLVTATKDLEHSGAAVLREELLASGGR